MIVLEARPKDACLNCTRYGEEFDVYAIRVSVRENQGNWSSLTLCKSCRFLLVRRIDEVNDV